MQPGVAGGGGENQSVILPPPPKTPRHSLVKPPLGEEAGDQRADGFALWSTLTAAHRGVGSRHGIGRQELASPPTQVSTPLCFPPAHPVTLEENGASLPERGITWPASSKPPSRSEIWVPSECRWLSLHRELPGTISLMKAVETDSVFPGGRESGINRAWGRL